MNKFMHAKYTYVNMQKLQDIMYSTTIAIVMDVIANVFTAIKLMKLCNE